MPENTFEFLRFSAPGKKVAYGAATGGWDVALAWGKAAETLVSSRSFGSFGYVPLPIEARTPPETRVFQGVLRKSEIARAMGCAQRTPLFGPKNGSRGWKTSQKRLNSLCFEPPASSLPRKCLEMPRRRLNC